MPIDKFLRRRPCTLTAIPLLATLLVLTAGCSDKTSSVPQQTQPAEAPAAPVAEQEPAPPTEAPEPVAEAAATQASAVDGGSVYQKACRSCHEAGIANAPKLGDSAAWAPRIAKGNDAMFESVKNGLNAMPPKGACMSCSEEELRAAMEYMISESS